MAQKKDKKLRLKYRVSIFNETTLAEVHRIRLSLFNILVYGTFLAIFAIALTTVLIAFTNLKEYIPGYPDTDIRRAILKNAELADSLEQQLDQQTRYINALKMVISGNLEIPDMTEKQDSDTITAPFITTFFEDLDLNASASDSAFRTQFESEEKYNLALFDLALQEKQNSGTDFINPVSGIVTQKFEPYNKHYGIDIATSENANIVAIDKGTIIFADWTIDYGYVIYIQHDNNFISVYKHNSRLLRKMGEKVLKGEFIAVSGNEGELSQGIHLHLEIWNNGECVNPLNYLKY